MGTSILILDDEELIRSSLSDYFEDLGWTPIQAVSAEEASAILDCQHVDFMTVDLRLGGLNGADFALAAKRIYPQMKILIFTGSFDFAFSEEMIEEGFSPKNILLKPIDRIEIIRDALLAL